MLESLVTDERGDDGIDRGQSVWLLCRAGSSLCALPMADVVETMRALPIEPCAGVPPYILGLAVIRGAPTLVVDAAALLSGRAGVAGRLVTIRTGARLIALAVDGVEGVRRIDGGSQALPPLIRAAASEVVAAIGHLDSALLRFLSTARIIPDGLFDRRDGDAT